jgi:hypothetical protein
MEGGMVAHRSRQNLKLDDTTGMAALLEKQAQDGVGLFVEHQILLAVFEDAPKPPQPE